MLSFYKVPLGALISLIFTWPNVEVKHLSYDHSEKMAVFPMQLSVIEGMYLLENLLSTM